MNKITLRGSSALCSTMIVSALLLAGAPAYGQTAPAPVPNPDAVQAPPAKSKADTKQDVNKEDDEKNVIVVTGSRIKTTAFNSPNPIAVIDPELAEKRGVFDTAELLQSSPISSGSAQVTSAISSNFVTDGGPGASTISLRGLGANRTLVLLNSRRAGPAGTRGAVSAFDLNVLPESIIQQVQIEKDGASSIYGSDAVAGVVNIITKTKTNGLEIKASGNPSQDGGGDQYRVSASWGKEWGGDHAGHILFAADYYHQTELAQGQRRYLDCPEDYVFSPSGARVDLVNPTTGSRRCAQLSWGQVYLYDYTGATVRTGRGGFSYGNENLGRYVPNLSPAFASGGFTVPSNFYMMGYDPASASIDHLYNPLYAAATVIPDTKRLTFYGDGSVKLNDHIELYFEGLWNRRKTYQNGFRQFWDYQYTEDFGGPRSPGFSGGVLSPTPITDWADSSQNVTYWRAVGGARGDFGSLLSSWTWDGFVQYSKSVGLYSNNQIYNDSIQQQTNYGFGGSCTNADLTAVRKAPCLVIDWLDPNFLAGSVTQAQRNYLFGNETGRTLYEQLNVELSATGNLFRLPAGVVSAAVGVAWRRDSIFDRPGNITYALKAGADPTLASSYTNNSWGNTSSGITAGHNITKEAYGEIDIPVIHNARFIQEFGVSGSIRVTNSTATRDDNGLLYPDPANPGRNIPQKLTAFSDNGNITYKIGANWKVNDWLRFRGTWGTSYRAPALFEDFLADQSSFISQRAIDPCINYAQGLIQGTTTQIVATNCAAAGIPGNYTGGAATATVLTGGGVGVVHAETSTAKTASIILTPRFEFLPRTRLNLAVDYFNIEVKGEISQLGAANIVAGCYSSNFFPTDPLCSLFTRQTTAPVNAISTVRDSFINVNRQLNEGIDVTGNVSQDLGNLGKLDFTAEMTWQLVDKRALFSGTEQDLNGRVGDPRWTGSFNLLWKKGSWSAYYGLNVIGGSSDLAKYLLDGGSLCYTTSAIFTSGYCESLSVPAVFYHSASLTKKLKGVEVTIGVTNLFNTKPPRVSTFNNGVTSTYGQSVFSSQYDLIGRRGFVTVKANF